MNMSPEAIAAREAYFAEKKLKKKKKTPIGVSNDDIELALHKFHGNISKAADFVGMDHYAVRHRIYNNERLLAARRDITAEFVDDTEDELKKLVKAGNPSAIIFVLKTLGKDRGYVERSTVEHELGPQAMKNAANMIEAMRKGMLEAPPVPLPPSRMIASEEDIDEGKWHRVEGEVDGGGDLQSVESPGHRQVSG